MNLHVDTSSWASAERRAARALAANKTRISKTKRGTSSSATLERRRRRKKRPTL